MFGEINIVCMDIILHEGTSRIVHNMFFFNPSSPVLIILVVVLKKKNQWPFQEPKLEVPTIYKAYVRPM